MLNTFFWMLMGTVFGLNASSASNALDNLYSCDKEAAVELLENTPASEIWDTFLRAQTDLYLSQESEWLSEQPCWQQSRDVLEIGSGNGYYLAKLSQIFSDKNYQGIEKEGSLIDSSTAHFASPYLSFSQGDAQILKDSLIQKFDTILYRLTLQHLDDPRLALNHAYHYLKPGGSVIVIDAYDPAKESSHVIPSIEHILRDLNEKNRETGRGNRSITIELLSELEAEAGPLSPLFRVTHTSLNSRGERTEKGVRFESEVERLQLFKHSLLLSAVLKKKNDLAIDLSQVYSELQVYKEDPTAWLAPGMHLLILQKRDH